MWRLIRGFGPDEEVDGLRRTGAAASIPTTANGSSRSSPARTPARFRTLPSSTASATATGTISGSSVAAARSNGSPTGGRHASSGTDTDITSLKNGRGAAAIRQYLADDADGDVARRHPGGRCRRQDHLVQSAVCRDVETFRSRFATPATDAPVLAAVTAAMLDPERSWLACNISTNTRRSEGQDRLETKDGRFIDRHTGVLRTAQGDILGRVWFFRDITEEIRCRQEERQNIPLCGGAQQHDAGPVHVRSRQAACRVEPPLRGDVQHPAGRRSHRHAARGNAATSG